LGDKISLVYEEEELLPISALQHLLFCERRAALILLEGLWQDNIFTAEGSVLHEQVHQIETESRGSLRIARGLWLRSLHLGLCGRADVVEFQRLADNAQRSTATTLPDVEGLWQPFPVEYKRGRLRNEVSFEIQLCAQALCLEEMLSIQVFAGAIYYGKARRRLEVPFNHKIRDKVEVAAKRLHALVSSGITPTVRPQAKCRLCSLIDVCLPAAMSRRKDVPKYLKLAYSLEENAI